MTGKTFLFLAITNLCATAATAQPMTTKPKPPMQPQPLVEKPDFVGPAANAEDARKLYDWRVQQTKIAGQYIPKDIFDAFKELEKLTDSTSRNKFRDVSEYDAEHKLYFSLGRWICSNWGLYEGSRLGQYFREAGLSFPEDQAVAVLVGWHRKLNGKDIGFKEIRERFAAKHQKEREARLKKAETSSDKPTKSVSKN